MEIRIRMLAMLIVLFSFLIARGASSVHDTSTLGNKIRPRAQVDDVSYVSATIPFDGASSNATFPGFDKKFSQGVYHTPTKRQASSSVTDYPSAVKNGECQIAALENQAYGPPSDFTEWYQLTQNGWTEVDDAPSDNTLDKLTGLFQAMKWNKQDFKIYNYVYEQNWIENSEYPWGYEANYELWINAKAGAIAVILAYSPQKPYIPLNKPAPQPLTRLSDFTFLVWQQACGGDQTCMEGLSWIIHDNVVNGVSWDVMHQAIRTANVPMSKWPGTRFLTNTDPGRALVGCPNGYGAAFLLNQANKYLTAKTIDYAVIFDNDSGFMDLALHFKAIG